MSKVKAIINMLAEELEKRGMSIDLVNGSVFEHLESPVGAVESSTSIASNIANKVGAEVLLYKTKFIPFMQEVTGILEDKLKEYPDASVYDKFKIVEFKLPAICKILKKEHYITTARESKIGNDSLLANGEAITIPVPSKEDMLTYTKHSRKLLDSYLDEILSAMTYEDVAAIWEQYFSNISSDNISLMQIIGQPMLKVKELVILWIIAGNLQLERPAGTNGTEDRYNEIMNYLITEFNNSIAIAIERLESLNKLQTIILDISKDNSVITVNAEMYHKYLSEGGDTDAIIGYVVSDHDNIIIETTLDEFKAKTEEYKNKFNNGIRLEKLANANKRYTKCRMVYELCIPAIIENIPEDLKPYVVADLTEATARGAIRDIMQTMPQNDVLVPELVAREIVGKIIFPASNFSQFTHNMLEYSKISSDFNSKDVASFAIIDMILDYLLNQITINNNAPATV